MDTAYNDALAFVLRWEGGFVDDPADHGGRTMKGVTQNVYNAWRASQGKPPGDVKNIADDEVAAIYQNDYWRKALCNVLQSNIDLVQFDTAFALWNRRRGRCRPRRMSEITPRRSGRF
jgi:lysozyme family protein